MTAEIVVLGSGYVGLWTARRIGRSLRSGLTDGTAHLTVVSAMDHHAFHGWTAEVLTGDMDPQHARVQIVDLVPKGTSFVHGTVTAVDLDAQTVAVDVDGQARTLSYDQLVIAVGSRDARDRIVGLRAHGFSVKDDGQLAVLNNHLTEVVAEAAATTDEATRRRLLTAVVAGGGLAGTEMAVAILDRLRDETRARPELADLPRDLPHVTLVHSHEELVDDMHPKLAAYAALQLYKAGVRMLLEHRVVAVTEDGATIDDGTTISAATVLSALGQDVVQLPGTEHLERDPRGRLVTDRYLRVARNVWSGGDVAAVPHPWAGGYCRADALWAIAQGKDLGVNVAQVVTGNRPEKFRDPGIGRASSLGIGKGAGELRGGIPLIGWSAWLLRWVLFHYSMPSRRVAVAAALAWFKGRPDVHTRAARRVHLH